MEEEREEISCECQEIHEDLLKIVNETMPDEEELYDLADLNMTQSAVSHQLRILKQNKLVKARRDGKSIFYSLADDHVRTIISMGREHILE